MLDSHAQGSSTVVEGGRTSGRRSVRPREQRRDPYMVFAQIIGLALVAFSTIVLAGWCLDLPALPRTFTDSVPVKINTAVSFLLLGLLLSPGRLPRRCRGVATGLSLALAVPLAVLGLTTAAEHFWGLNLGVDELFGPDRFDTVCPGRMSLNAALAFPLLGASVLLARRPRRWAAWAAQLAGLATFLMAYLAILGYVFGVSDLYKLNSYTAMAPQSAVAMLLASLACLARGRRAGPVTCFASAHSGGALLRWMLAPLALLMPLLAWLCLLGLRLQLHEPESGLALYATVSFVILGVALWLAAFALNRIDARRSHAERQLRSMNETLELRVAERTDAVRRALGQREELLSREKALRRELDHRVRNNLAGLMGLVAIYERSGRSSSELATAVRGKILAMKEVHDIIARAAGRPVLLKDLLDRLIRSAVPDTSRARVVAELPTAQLNPTEAAAFAMVVQELITNSLKYGALSLPDGRVRVRGRIETRPGNPHLRFDWRETGVPLAPGEACGGSRIGLQLIRDFARSDLHGAAEFASGPGSWRCVVAARPAGLTRPESPPRRPVPQEACPT